MWVTGPVANDIEMIMRNYRLALIGRPESYQMYNTYDYYYYNDEGKCVKYTYHVSSSIHTYENNVPLGRGRCPK